MWAITVSGVPVKLQTLTQRQGELSENLNENIEKTSYHLRKVLPIDQKISTLEANVLETMPT